MARPPRSHNPSRHLFEAHHCIFQSTHRKLGHCVSAMEGSLSITCVPPRSLPPSAPSRRRPLSAARVALLAAASFASLATVLVVHSLLQSRCALPLLQTHACDTENLFLCSGGGRLQAQLDAAHHQRISARLRVTAAPAPLRNTDTRCRSLVRSKRGM